MDLSEFSVDLNLYEDGKRIELGKGAHIRVRAAGSDKASKVRERLWKPYASWKEIPPEISARINAQWIAQGLLVEMVGFTVDKKPLELDLSKPEDQKRLADIIVRPEYKAFRNKVIGIAIEEANFQSVGDAALEGN